MVNGPSALQIYLRAGWTVGAVQDRYLFAGEGGDQLTGRALSGLPFNDSTFATLPPHFDPDKLQLIRWSAVLPLYEQLPETFKRTLPFLLAAICYHEQWLRATLPTGHPLFSSYLFASGDVQNFKPYVLTGRGHCPITDMSATGIPSHWVLYMDLTDVAKQTQLMKDAILSKCSELPSELVTKMLDHFTINGAIPVTLNDIKSLLNSAVSQLRTEMRDNRPSPNTSSTAAATTTAATINPADDPRFDWYCWKEKMHMVPEWWRSTNTDVKATWNLWHFGHLADRIRPLRYLLKIDLQSKGQISLWSKTKGVLTVLTDVMVEMDMLTDEKEVLTWTGEQASAAFDAAFRALMERTRAGSTRGKGR